MWRHLNNCQRKCKKMAPSDDSDLRIRSAVTCRYVAQTDMCRNRDMSTVLTWKEKSSSSSFVRQLSYFQAGRCQPDPGVLVQVGQAPLSIRWPVHCAVVHDVLHRLVWRTTSWPYRTFLHPFGYGCRLSKCCLRDRS